MLVSSSLHILATNMTTIPNRRENLMVTNPLDYYSTANSAEIFNQLYQIQFLQPNFQAIFSFWLIKQLFFFWKKKFSLQLFFAGHKFSTLQEHIFNNCLDIWRYEALCRSFSEFDFEKKTTTKCPRFKVRPSLFQVMKTDSSFDQSLSSSVQSFCGAFHVRLLHA